MPKTKADHLQTIRFELQDRERELLESFLMTWQVGKAASALDQLLSLENAYLAVTLYEIMTGEEVLPGTPNDIYQLIEWAKEYAESREDDLNPLNVFISGLQEATIFGQAGGWNWLDAFRSESEDG